MTFQSWLSGLSGPQIANSPQDAGAYQQQSGRLLQAAMGAMGQSGANNAGLQNQAPPNAHPSFGGGDQSTNPWDYGPFSGYSNPQAGWNQTMLGGITGGIFGGTGGGGLTPQRDPAYYQDLGQQFTNAQGFLMDQTGPGGMLSESSMNPYTRQLAEGNAYSERQRQSNMGYGLASAGMNPLMAQRVMGEGDQYAQEQLGTQFAQFNQDLQGRQYAAGEGITNLSNALTGEMTSRKEDQSRWADEYRLSDKHGIAMAKAAKSGAKSDLMGSAMGVAGMMVMASDRRMKKNIKRIGEHSPGIGLYEYAYKWEDKMRVGVMADEVILEKPEAVSEVAGYLFVDYSQL